MPADPSSGDYYERLGVAPDAQPEEIKAAFREMRKELHPDSRPESLRAHFNRMMQNVNEAHQTLKDPIARVKYDATRRASTQGQQQRSARQEQQEEEEVRRRANQERREREARERQWRKEWERERQRRAQKQAEDAAEKLFRPDAPFRAEAKPSAERQFVVKPSRIYSHPEGSISMSLQPRIGAQPLIWVYPDAAPRPIYYEFWMFPPGRWSVVFDEARQPLPVRFCP